MTPERVRIASYPARNPGNPVIELFCQALGEYGVQLAGALEVDSNWLRRQRGDLDGIFVHWPERIWRGHSRGRLDRVIAVLSLRRLRRLARMWSFLRTAGQLRIMRVWTVHNLGHHEGVAWSDRVGYRFLASQCDLLVCYSESAAHAIKSRYGRTRPVLSIRHGNYDNVYPPPRPRDVVLTELGLQPQRPVVCCVGLLRRYKGIELACDAIRSLSGEVQLIVAGHPWSEADLDSVRRAMAGLSGAVLRPAKLSDQEFADTVAACDAVLLPYSAITGSGVLLAAWTLGSGVVASDLPYFREMIPAGSDSGMLVSMGDPKALADGISKYLTVPAERRRAAALTQAARHSWTRCVEPLAEAVLAWKDGREPRLEGARA
jgi:glycosyltransferase involved in cell wall biosynthesis